MFVEVLLDLLQRGRVAAVRAAEALVVDEADAWISRGERASDERKDLLALEEIVPELADRLAIELRGARGEHSGRCGGGGERPHDVVHGLGVRHGPDLYHRRPALCEIRRRERSRDDERARDTP